VVEAELASVMPAGVKGDIGVEGGGGGGGNVSLSLSSSSNTFWLTFSKNGTTSNFHVS
jgi:hypothetical protein